MIIAAVLLLNALLSLGILWPTPWVTWRGALSVELGALLVLLAILQGVAPRMLPRLALPLALLLLVFVIGHYGEVVSDAFYGRPINLYWDAPHLANVGAMFAGAAPAWQVGAAVVAFIGVLSGLVFLLLRVLRVLLRAQEEAGPRRALLATGILLLVGYVAARQDLLPDAIEYAQPVSATYGDQWRRVRDSAANSGAARALPPSPPLPANLGRLGGADVVLVFVESYGASTYDLPRYRDALRDARASLVMTAAATGREVRSSFVRSPTFSGGSWLAHLSLLSGVQVTDPDSYALLMTQQRSTMIDAFRAAGYRSIAMMPGMRLDWPEGAFYGFDAIHDARAIQWQGPEFGWWRIPDQFTLARLLDLEFTGGKRPPLFAVVATVTTHLPFEPVPPLQPDWQRLRGSSPYAADVLAQSLARQPDWLDLGRSYIDAVDYSLRSLAGLLQEHADPSLVLVIVGDHQPAANVSGSDASWDVPVHVVTGNTAVLAALDAAGFTPGVDPPRTASGPMSGLFPRLLRSFELRAAD